MLTSYAEAEKKFVEISQAYQVLSDPEQKEKYDQFGEDAFRSGGHGNYYKFIVINLLFIVYKIK